MMQYRFKKDLGVLALSIFLSACGGGGGGSETKNSSANASQTEIKAAIALQVSSSSASQVPANSTTKVTISGQGVTRIIELTDTSSIAEFNDLIVGQYHVIATITSNGVELEITQMT